MSNADKTGPDKIAPILLRNAPNIKHFVLGKKQYDSMTAGDNSSNDIDSIPPNKNWTPVFYSFSAPNLRSLVLDNIPYNQSGSLLTMIQQCPSLEALAICNRYHMDLDFSIERGSVIETILLGPAVPNITCTFLLALTLIRTIKHIRAVIDSNRHLYNKEDDRCLFGELLGRTCIESLTLYGVCYLPQPFLCSLSDLPLLKDIHFNAGTATTSFFRQAMNETPRNVLSVLVNRQGFLDMLYKTSSLKCIVIRCAKDPSNTIIATIKNEKQLLDKYSAKTIDFRGWKRLEKYKKQIQQP
ncbi:hypothetical protein BDA99DRAFT_609457 [Phascolomyces articulosus]|uniref:Uncharacterized protein n=1 Tax=Phascolomyces articulosus TaxID=60185 RepID=A0AAD5JZJ5_9FUNG|nr:hypothetical protein BDA99DRAFT_609457 [Phascolomyces articulosus]